MALRLVKIIAECSRILIFCLRKSLNAAARERRLKNKMPLIPRGEFSLEPDQAISSKISQRGAVDHVVMNTDSISKEDNLQTTTDFLRPQRKKKARLLNLRSSRLYFQPTAGRHSAKGKPIGGTQISVQNAVNNFIRFSMPGHKSQETVGEGPAVAGACEVVIEPRGIGRSQTRRHLVDAGPINAVGATSPQTVRRNIAEVQLAIDRKIIMEKMAEKADIIHIQVDSSTFGEHSMQAVLVTLLFISKLKEGDALGTPLFSVSKRSWCLNSLRSSDKKAQDLMQAGGDKFYRKEASFNFGLQLIMAGLAWILLFHHCVVLSLDRGSEAVGAGKGKTWAARRAAFNGRGGYLEQVWGTREALGQPMESIHQPYLVRLMSFLGVPEEHMSFESRKTPEVMDTTSEPVLRVPMPFVELTREIDSTDPTKKNKIIKTERCMLNSRDPRVSTHMHPLARYPLYDGGSADADWCVKHCLATAVKQTTKGSKGFFREVMRMIRLFRNKYIWVEVRAQASAILAEEGSREFTDVDQALYDALGPERMKQIKLNNPHGLTLPVEACETRWGLLYAGAAMFYVNLLLFSALAPLALADGTRENKIKAMQEVCKLGFVVKNTISYANPRVGRAVYYMSQPDFILRLAIVRFLHVICWQPCMAATAHRNDCSMAKIRGMGSIMRTVQWVLTRGIWASAAMQKMKEGKHGSVPFRRPWKMKYKVGHRGPAEAELARGIFCLFLSSRLEDRRAWRVRGKGHDNSRCISDDVSGTGAQTISPLQHLYGDFYTPAMAHAITDLQKAIREACSMSIAEEYKHIAVMLPEERRKHYLRNKIASTTDSANTGIPGHSSWHFRIQQSIWIVHQETCAAACALSEKFKLTTNDPLGFLAGILGVEHHRLIPGVFDFDHGSVQTFYTSSVTARANAAVLHLQVREILQHNPEAGKFVNAPLKHVFTTGLLEKLKTFSLGDPVQSLLMIRGTLASDENGNTPAMSTLFFPVNCMPDLHKAASLAAARITHSNDIESRWSILTGKYLSGMRNAGPMCLSQYVRKPDFHSFSMREFIQTPDFYNHVHAAAAFRRRNEDDHKLIYESRDDEIHTKTMELREKGAQENCAETNICGGKKTATKTLKDPRKTGRGERKMQPRNQSNQLDGSFWFRVWIGIYGQI